MELTVLHWLRTVGWSAFTLALGGLFVVNAIAIVAFLAKRDRRLVNTWTGPVVAANILLVAIGVGVPLVTSVARLAIMGARGVVPSMLFQQNDASDAPAAGSHSAD